MRRTQLEHIIRAAAGITGMQEFVVIGSQAVLGQFPDAPDELLISMEADIFSSQDATAGDLIEGSIGEGSPFHQTFGYYAQGVSDDTAVLPAGWRERLVPIRNANTGGGVGRCLEVHDLAVSKLLAGREKDFEFVAGLLRHGLIRAEVIQDRLEVAPADVDHRALCRARLKRLAETAG